MAGMPDVTRPPSLSFAERDRRWAAVRALMREHEVECLLVAGFRSREMYESYICDDYNEGCTIMPLEGDPVVLTWANLRVLRDYASRDAGNPFWVDDYRVAITGGQAAEVVREKGLGSGKLGVVGLTSMAPTEMHGAIPAGWWNEFTEALPGLKYVDLSEEFSFLMLVKSPEELGLIRYAAAAAEAACGVMRQVVEPGVDEALVIAEATREMLRFGIGLRYPNIVMNSGAATLSWGPPRWTTRCEAPRILKRGELLQAELMPMCGNQEIQVQMTVALDPIDDVSQKCERVAREAYDVGLKTIRPGIQFSDLVQAMAEPLKVAGCWAYTPLLHSISPHFLMGRTAVNQENLDLGVRFVGPGGFRNRQTVIKPGMVFAFEPNACIDHHRVNLGGTIIVTESGCEELNAIPTRVTHK